MNNNNKTLFITGAAGGVGRATIKQFSDAGYRIWATDLNKQALQQLEQEFSNLTSIAADISNPDQLADVCKAIEESEHTINVAHVNAGVIQPNLLEDTHPDSIDLQLDVNLRAAMHINRAVAKKMQAQQHGHIVNTVSMGAFVALPKSAVYSATKAGLRSFINALQLELKPHGISVSGVYPSGIHTPMLQHEALNGGTPLTFLNMPVSADKVAKAVLKSVTSQRLEYYLPYFDSLTSRLLNSFPWLLKPIYPLLEKIGEHGRKKYIKKYNVGMSE